METHLNTEHTRSRKVHTYMNTADDILCNGMLFIVCYALKKIKHMIVKKFLDLHWKTQTI